MLARTEFVNQNELLAEVPHLKAYARLMMNDIKLADRAVQTSIEKALAFLESMRLSRLPRTWPLHILRELFFSDDSLAQPYGNTEDSTAKRAHMARRELCQALAALPFDEREAVILTSTRAYTPFEIAQVCDCDQFDVATRYRSGISKLLNFLYAPQSVAVH